MLFSCHRPVFFVFCLIILAGQLTRAQVNQDNRLRFVDPLIGTGKSTTISALRHSEGATEGYAQVIPAVTAPFGLTNWTPQTRATEQKCLAPYYYDDKKIQGFRGTHWMSGSCTQDYGSFTLMPVTGTLRTMPEARAGAYRHETETATPAYYAVRLDDYAIRVEVTATARAALFRITFEEAGDASVILQPNSDEGQGGVFIDPENREVSGYNPAHRIYQGWGEPAGFSGHFVAQFSRSFTQHGTFSGEEIQSGQSSLSDRNDLGAFASLPVQAGDTLLIRVGTSFTSIEQARKNLEAEITHWDFERVRRELESTWNELLSRAAVTGDSEEDKVKFYTALYHSFLLPRRFNDADGTYVSFAGDSTLRRVSEGDYYVDFSMWDTYRAIHPLFNLLLPERSRDMMRSLVLKAEQGGWLPIFPCWNQYTAAMIGDHVIATLGDAYAKGIRGWDVESAYRLMRQNAFKSPGEFGDYKDGKGRRALESYRKYGYVPLDDPVEEAFHKREQVSRTLEYAYDDFVLAQVARALGRKRDYRKLRDRAHNYRNVFHPGHGYVCGRYADGRWTDEFQRSERMPYITEGTPQHYTWYVPHDIAGLMELMGGPDVFIAKLDSLFGEGQYWHGNEPCHQIAYLYNYAGAPEKTQHWVRQIMAEEYGTGPGGLSGNDDTGQMSAWYVFSAMGFYPVCPGVPEYVLGSPIFDSVTLTFPDGKHFRIKAENNSRENKYIRSARLNGAPYEKTFIRHEDMVKGGTLIFKMTEEATSGFGKGAGAAPFSMAQEK